MFHLQYNTNAYSISSHDLYRLGKFYRNMLWGEVLTLVVLINDDWKTGLILRWKISILVLVLCRKIPILSENSNIVGKIQYWEWFSVGKLPYCRKIPILQMYFCISHVGNLFRHPDRLVQLHPIYRKEFSCSFSNSVLSNGSLNICLDFRLGIFVAIVCPWYGPDSQTEV